MSARRQEFAARSLSLRNLLQVTKALADEQRVRLLMLLEAGELCVCQLFEVLELAPSTVSKHLSILRAAGLVDCRKAGRWAYYRLADGQEAEAGRPMVAWLRQCLDGDAVIARDRRKRAEVLECDLEELCQRKRKAC